jgi:hypothetical protein
MTGLNRSKKRLERHDCSTPGTMDNFLMDRFFAIHLCHSTPVIRENKVCHEAQDQGHSDGPAEYSLSRYSWRGRATSGPANHFARVQVQHDRQIQPSLRRTDIRYVRNQARMGSPTSNCRSSTFSASRSVCLLWSSRRTCASSSCAGPLRASAYAPGNDQYLALAPTSVPGQRRPTLFLAAAMRPVASYLPTDPCYREICVVLDRLNAGAGIPVNFR